jgi:uncharacterized Tic20 family protein
MTDEKLPTQDEKVLAAIAHASILLGLLTNGVAGIVTALIIWVTQREKSAYAAYQALQATVYQIAGVVIALSLWACWGLLVPVATLIPIIINPGAYQESPPGLMFLALSLACIPLIVTAIWVLYGLWGALRALSGADFRYIVIGRVLPAE